MSPFSIQAPLEQKDAIVVRRVLRFEPRAPRAVFQSADPVEIDRLPTVGLGSADVAVIDSA
jgi:hypothetical protein